MHFFQIKQIPLEKPASEIMSKEQEARHSFFQGKQRKNLFVSWSSALCSLPRLAPAPSLTVCSTMLLTQHKKGFFADILTPDKAPFHQVFNCAPAPGYRNQQCQAAFCG